MAVTVASSSFNGSLQVPKSCTSKCWSQGSRGQELVAHAELNLPIRITRNETTRLISKCLIYFREAIKI